MPKAILQAIILAVLTIGCFFLLSFKILEVPTGLTVDESAFGLNAVLLSRTLHDENGEFLPLYVHSINKTDWRQPFTQYYLVLIFKLLGASIYNLRISSVFLVLLSSLLLFFLIKKILNYWWGIVAFLMMNLTPVVFMHSHLGLDNIMPIPFVILWLLFLFNKRYFWSAFLLAASFYTYKGMRAIVPVWGILSIVYLYFSHKKLKPILNFVLGTLPWIALIPFIQSNYPGAIFGGARPKFDTFYNFFYPFLSHLDPTFLFIKGDNLLFHSTQIHGMYLLATMPFFYYGLYSSLKSKKFIFFIGISWIMAPFLMGLVESTYRASRILSTVPLFIIITTYALSKIKIKLIIPVIFIIILLNFLDFSKYYWFTYPKFTENIFGHLDESNNYKQLSIQAKELNLTPFEYYDIHNTFYHSLYLSKPPNYIFGDSLPPAGSIFYTNREKVPGMKRLNVNMTSNYLHIYE